VDLAKRYRDVCAQPVQQVRRDLWRRHNSLKQTRPLLYMRVFACWHEMPDAALSCEDPFLRQHENWLRRFTSTLGTTSNYSPTDCFDTFPFPPEEYERMANSEWRVEEMPEAFQWAAQVGAEYHEHRRQIMLARNLGLTKTYNLFHAPACGDADIVRLRELHAEMDRAILACYGWEDVDLRHDFYPNDRGQMRYTVSPEARRELLRRLLELNQKIAEGK
jgi:hypothetical protein